MEINHSANRRYQQNSNLTPFIPSTMISEQSVMISPTQFKQASQQQQQQYQGFVQRQLWQQRRSQQQQQQAQNLNPNKGDNMRISTVAPSSLSSLRQRAPLTPIAPNVQGFNFAKSLHQNDYSNHHLHSGRLPSSYIKNIKDPIEGYPKLQKLFQLKEQQISKYAIKPYGCRVESGNMIETLDNWINKDKLVFDVIMIGALTENQFIYPLLARLPIDRLCSKPGFLFIWASTQKINELTKLLSNNLEWSKKFRRSEELVFVPANKDSKYYPYKDSSSIEDEKYFEKMQWHCWMAITGTVRRSTDNHLINCNIDTDLTIETETTTNNAVPPFIYRVAENFSSSTRRLHIIPSRTGINKPVKVRPGWVILSPDVLLNNFDAETYKRDIARVGTNVQVDEEIERLRPKSPIQRQR